MKKEDMEGWIEVRTIEDIPEDDWHNYEWCQKMGEDHWSVLINNTLPRIMISNNQITGFTFAYRRKRGKKNV